MFYSISGKIINKDASSVAVECAGIGFQLTVSMNTLQHAGNVGDTVFLYTFLSVREDAVELFGFYDSAELDCFRMLTAVSGVGPKAAVSILSELDPDNLALCIAQGDVKRLTAAQGIGPKIAQRVILELKDKMSKRIPGRMPSEKIGTSVVKNGSNTDEAISALCALGYTGQEAAAALRGADGSLPVDALIKYALKNIAGRF